MASCSWDDMSLSDVGLVVVDLPGGRDLIMMKHNMHIMTNQRPEADKGRSRSVRLHAQSKAQK